MSKSLLEKMEEAIRRPVPYEGLRVEPPDANVTHAEPRPAPAGRRPLWPHPLGRPAAAKMRGN
jgi:hypothetical protein